MDIAWLILMFSIIIAKREWPELRKNEKAVCGATVKKKNNNNEEEWRA